MILFRLHVHACDILLSEADLPFRATKDIDDDTSSLSAILLNDDYKEKSVNNNLL